MSQKSYNRKQERTAKSKKPTPPSAPISPKRYLKKFIPSNIYPILLIFALLWIFAGVIYSDVFYMSEQSSFFAFNKMQMRFILQQPFGAVAVIGRFALLSFHYPWLGSFIFSFLLTAITILTTYVFRLKKYWRIIAVLLPFGFILWLLALGLSICYNHEPSVVFSIPIVAFILLLLLSVIRYIFNRRRHIKQVSSFENKHSFWAFNATIIALSCVVYFMAIFSNQNVRLTCQMQRQMLQQDWQGMVKTALKSSHPTRAIAAYYAIALTQTDQICDRLFDLSYNYKDMGLRTRDGLYDTGTNYYQSDCCFYSGLLCTSYHFAMERMVSDGPTIYMLKRLALCAMLNGENNLSKKYLEILRTVPFEQNFVDQVQPLIGDAKSINNNSEYKHIVQLIPMVNTFEQVFQAPIFIGYNVVITTGRSMAALQNSIAACLYAKDMEQFALHVQPLAGSNYIPRSVSDAVTMQQTKNQKLAQSFPADQWGIQQLNSFLLEAKNYSTDRESGRDKLFKQFRNYYPYYYYFENLPTNKEGADKKEKGGVN